MDREMIECALRHAAEELTQVAQMEPRERILQETQLQCSLYRYFRNKGMSVHAEAGCLDSEDCRKGNHQKYCDLIVSSGRDHQTWIELAIGSHHDKSENSRALRNKPAKIEKWHREVHRLTHYAPESAEKMLLVLGLFDGNPQNGAGERLVNMAGGFHKEWKFGKDFRPFKLSWRNAEMYGKFWAWKWK